MKMVLYIDGKLRYEMPMALENNLFTNRCLLFNAVQKIKLMYEKELRESDWEIFIQMKSKLNELKGKSKRII